MAIPIRRAFGYAAAVASLLLLYDTETFIRTNWSPLRVPMTVANEFTLSGGLAIVAVVFLAGPALLRLAEDCGPGEAIAICHKNSSRPSLEARLRRRFPLRRRFAALPDRGVVFGTPVLVLLVVITVWNLPPVPLGIFVSISDREYKVARSIPDEPIVAQVKAESRVVRFLVDGKDIPVDGLRDAIKRDLSRRQVWVVFIVGDGASSVQDVVMVVDIVKGLHARPVLLTRAMINETGRTLRTR